jgi:predicted nucleotidyltransferase
LECFGSFARGEETPDSDIDILVEFSEVPGMIDFLKTEEYLETVLKRKIDLVRENAIRPELKGVIMSEVIMI